LPGAVLGSRGSSFSHCSSFKNEVVRAIGSPPIAYYLKSLKKSSDLTCRLYYILRFCAELSTTHEVMKPVLDCSA
jgi:hypothetical protein